MQEERKKIIQYALGFDIQDIHTYSGYKGDLIVKIVTKERDVLGAIRSFALSLGVKDVVIKQNVDMRNYEIYCITVDEHVYGLKTVDITDEIHAERSVKDPWDGKKVK